MKLYLVRHGQSFSNVGSVGARMNMPDSDLTEMGYNQVILTSKWLKNHDYRTDIYQEKSEKFRPCALYSSPARRGLKTAACIASELGLQVGVDTWFHEVGGAAVNKSEVWGGLTQDRALEIVGEGYLVRKYPTLGWWFQPREKRETALLRVHKWLEWLLTKHECDDVVIVVGHGELFDCLAAVAFGHKEKVVWMSMHNAAIARIDRVCDEWRLVFWNQHEHLKSMMSY